MSTESKPSMRLQRPARRLRTDWWHATQGVFLGAFAALASSGAMPQARAQAYPAQLVNSVEVRASGVTDPDLSNNQAQDVNALAATAALSIQKSLLDTGPFLVGQVVRYSIVVSNAGPSAAAAVEITDLPENLELLSVTGACSALPCTLDSLAAGGSAALEVSARIVAAGHFGNSASVDAPGVVDPDPSDNTSDGGGGEASVAPPKPADDSVGTPQNTAVDVDVLGNDDGDGGPLDPATVDVTIVTPPASGSAQVGSDGRIHYVPGTHYSGDDTLVYQVCVRGTDACATASVAITVQRNRLEVVDDEVDGLVEGVDVDVLANDRTSGAPLDPASLTVESAPAHGTATCTASGCHYLPTEVFTGEDRFTYRVCDVSVPTRECGTATVVVRAPEPPLNLRLAKRAAVRTVSHGDLVRYTITVQNLGEFDARGVSLLDTLPAGFTWVAGSLQVEDVDNQAGIGATSPLRIDGIDVDAGETATISYSLRVGAGVGPGVHRNVVVARDAIGRSAGNQASAEVTFKGDPMFQDSLVIGTVFDDRDGNGQQAPASATGLRMQGGFDPAAYVPNSTTIDRGDGPQPVADASAPLLHGLDLGELPGRSSAAVAPATVEVRQLLREPHLADGLVLTSAEGSTVRMDAQGRVAVERAGEVAAGRNGQQLQVQRVLGQVADGVELRYVVSNAGIDERGVPGVRLATVEGLLVQTDAFGRYHLAGIDAGNPARGRNFIVKLDPGTLPPGTALTTPNPLLQRVTPGLPVRFDFGARLPDGELRAAANEAVVLTAADFMAGGTGLADAGAVEAIAARLVRSGGGVVSVTGQHGDPALGVARAQAVRAALDALMAPALRAAVRVQLQADASTAPVLVLDAPPEVDAALLDGAASETTREAVFDVLAALLERSGGGTVVLAGAGADAADALARARVLFDALAARLPADLRQRLRVETSHEPVRTGGEGR